MCLVSGGIVRVAGGLQKSPINGWDGINGVVENLSNYNSYGWILHVVWTVNKMKNTTSSRCVIFHRSTDS